jgi:lipid-A-disaccharide synthase
MALLREDFPDLVPVIPSSPVVAELIARQTKSWAVKPVVVTALADKHDAYAAAAAALTKSGTSTLELALAGVPMAVTYRVNPLTAALARRMIKVEHVAMVNLLAGRRLVPELLQEDCTPEKLRAVLRALLRDDAAAAAQRTGFGAVMASLRAPVGLPDEAAARAILEVLDM